MPPASDPTRSPLDRVLVVGLAAAAGGLAWSAPLEAAVATALVLVALARGGATVADRPLRDSSAVADAAATPIGTLVLKGDRSVPGELAAGRSCGAVCGKIFGTCDSSSSGDSDYTCPNGTIGRRDHDCTRAPSAKTPSGCTLTSYTCACHDVPLANPYVAVEQDELPVTCAAACTSHGRTCDTAKPSAQYDGPQLGGGTAALGCDDEPDARSKSIRCYFR